MAVIQVSRDDVLTAKQTDMVEYLSGLGMKSSGKGKIIWFSSPFASDSTPSFAVYPAQNRFMDYSSGAKGDIIDLARELHNLSFRDAVLHVLNKNVIAWEKEKYKELEDKKKEFRLRSYLTYENEEKLAIREYAMSRGITEGYEHGAYYVREGEEWRRVPAMVFPHVNENMEITGAKFRNIDKNSKDRFTARGKLGFYILRNILDHGFDKPTLYLVESETSANSLYMYFKSINYSAIVMSHGGVGAAPDSVPFDLPLKIIIDYDGNPKLYNERLKLYKHLNGKAIKMQLPKGQDLNSLWVRNKMNIVNKIIL